MYHFKICNRIKLVYFIKFIVYEMNSEMVESEIVVLTGREKTDMSDADVAVDWMLYTAAEALIVESEREN
jgi:hypothetical protein